MTTLLAILFTLAINALIYWIYFKIMGEHVGHEFGD